MGLRASQLLGQTLSRADDERLRISQLVAQVIVKAPGGDVKTTQLIAQVVSRSDVEKSRVSQIQAQAIVKPTTPPTPTVIPSPNPETGPVLRLVTITYSTHGSS